MNAAERRIKIPHLLAQSDGPVSATALAAQCGVSRQIIVGDVALLRAGGLGVLATPRGYVLMRGEKDAQTYTIACRHGRDRLAEELYAVVDNGGALLDVIVDHAVYGQLSGRLHIFSRYDADEFLRKLSSNEASPLSSLTDGIHLHTLSCPSPECFTRICAVLREKGLLIAPEKD